MKAVSIQEISKSVRSINVTKFIYQVDHYLKTSAQTIRQSRNGTGAGKRLFQKIWFLTKKRGHGDLYAEMDQEASAILSKSSLSLKQMSDFRFRMNGQSTGVPETDEKTRVYFKKIRRQQVELLLGISDEIEIIRNIVNQSGQMRDIIRNHSEIMEKTTYLIDIMSQRFSQQSALPAPGPEPEHGNTSPLKTEDDDSALPVSVPEPEKERVFSLNTTEDELRQARHLSDTFRNMREYEDSFGAKLNGNSKKGSLEKASAAYHYLVQNSYEEIEQRKQRVITGVRELRQGCDILKKLVIKGYSDRIQGELDVLIWKHDNRADEFQRHILESREMGNEK
ncbi:Uncharacterized protein dnm_072520 [Desulfonema magnum]|uniref:Uncharacterized protein n=2 Tax=Desulfonema magnum TaxID=45655 RepID=A0A975BTF6_9BACT|nr:Uncharacterized protein dnm_072520 [Desulfonema magnum]